MGVDGDNFDDSFNEDVRDMSWVMMITMPRSLLHCIDLDLKGKTDSVTQVRFIGFGGISSFPDNFIIGDKQGYQSKGAFKCSMASFKK